MKEEIKMKWGGFIVNGHLYKFFSKERAILNRLLKGRRGGVWSSFQSSNKSSRRTGKGTAEVLGEHHNELINTYPVRSNTIHDKNPGEHVKATLCLVIYHTIFDSDGNMSRRPFIWLFITRFLIRIGTCQGDPLFGYLLHDFLIRMETCQGDPLFGYR